MRILAFNSLSTYFSHWKLSCLFSALNPSLANHSNAPCIHHSFFCIKSLYSVRLSVLKSIFIKVWRLTKLKVNLKRDLWYPLELKNPIVRVWKIHYSGTLTLKDLKVGRTKLTQLVRELVGRLSFPNWGPIKGCKNFLFLPKELLFHSKDTFS